MASIGKNEHKDDPMNVYLKNQIEDDPVGLLIAAIVIRAVDDWRELIRQRSWLAKAPRQVNFDELRNFFKSDWCDFLMLKFNVEPARVLDLLETELRDAMQREERKRKGRKK